MNKILSDMLRGKVNRKYVKSKLEVADYHGVNPKAVYRSLLHATKLDNLRLFNKASKIANCGDDVILTMRGSKEKLLDCLSKVMDDSNPYLIGLAEEV